MRPDDESTTTDEFDGDERRRRRRTTTTMMWRTRRGEHRPRGAARTGARAGDPVRHDPRGDRDRVADRLPAHRRAPSRTPGWRSTARPARPWSTRRRSTPTAALVREWDDTPHDFGRIAAMTAKQVILQRLREATDEVHFGEYVGRDGDLVTGVVQAHEARSREGHRQRRPGQAGGDAAAVRAGARRAYEHGAADPLRRGARGQGLPRPADHPVPVAPGLVKKLFALEVPEIADGTRGDRRDRP